MAGRALCLRFRWRIDEARGDVGGGDHAGVSFAEPNVAALGDQIVNPIANGRWNYRADSRQPAVFGQAVEDAEKCGGAAILAFALD